MRNGFPFTKITKGLGGRKRDARSHILCVFEDKANGSAISDLSKQFHRIDCCVYFYLIFAFLQNLQKWQNETFSRVVKRRIVDLHQSNPFLPQRHHFHKAFNCYITHRRVILGDIDEQRFISELLNRRHPWFCVRVASCYFCQQALVVESSDRGYSNLVDVRIYVIFSQFTKHIEIVQLMNCGYTQARTAIIPGNSGKYNLIFQSSYRRLAYLIVLAPFRETRECFLLRESSYCRPTHSRLVVFFCNLSDYGFIAELFDRNNTNASVLFFSGNCRQDGLVSECPYRGFSLPGTTVFPFRSKEIHECHLKVTSYLVTERWV